LHLNKNNLKCLIDIYTIPKMHLVYSTRPPQDSIKISVLSFHSTTFSTLQVTWQYKMTTKCNYIYCSWTAL